MPYDPCGSDTVTDVGLTDYIITRGRAEVGAIEALEVVEPSMQFESAIARQLTRACQRRLRVTVVAGPARVGNRILLSGENIPGLRAARPGAVEPVPREQFASRDAEGGIR